MFDENPFDLAAPDAPGRAHLSDYWSVLMRRRTIVLACILLGLAVAAVISLATPRSYRSTATLDVGNSRTAGMDLGLGEASANSTEPDPEFQATQIRLIGSSEVASRVASKLDLARDPDFVSSPRRSAKNPPPTAAESDKRSAWLARRVQRGLQISPVHGTDLVEVASVSSSPRLSAAIANATADAYIEWKVDSMYRAMSQISTFLGTQIAQLKREIDGQQQQLLAFGKANDIVSSDPQANSGLQNFESLNHDYAAAIADRVAKEARYRQLESASASIAADDPSQAALSTQLQNDQSRLERDYAQKLNLFKPEWPGMIALKEQIDRGRQHLQSVVSQTATKAREVARNDYLAAQRREGSLAAGLKSQRTATMEGNSNAVAYNNLRTEIDTRRALLDTLVRRQAETEVLARQKGARESSARVVDRAQIPESRFRPSYRMNGLLGLLAGLGLGALLVFFLEYLDRSFRSPEDVRKSLGLPTFGAIPAVESSDGRYGYFGRPGRRAEIEAPTGPVELIPYHATGSAVAEAYRRVRTALLLSQVGGVRSVVVTSGLAREGKTCTAANLAVILSQLNRRVLLVDADLHKPRLHEVFRTPNRLGLATMLTENLDPASCIVKTHVPGVFLLPAGPPPANPSGLLSSASMSRFLEWSKTDFDFVVIDTPPLFPIADALVLGHQTDGVVLCVRAGKTSEPQAARAKETLLQNQNRILGVVLNALPTGAGGYDEGYGSYFGRAIEVRDARSA
jgi:capsular exopolysaccharide synthesis family protein